MSAASPPTDAERLAELGELLATLPAPGPPTPERPVVLVVGAPRSGTTLLSQALAASGGLSYPSNLMSRFHRTPWVGARVQDMLAPVLERGPWRFTSDGGATEGWWEPHEFGYFWTRHLGFRPHVGVHAFDAAAARAFDGSALARDLAAWEAEARRPVLLKTVMASFVLEHLAAAVPTLRVLCVRRPAAEVERSLLGMRRRSFGTESRWFSVRPPGAAQADAWSPARQVAWQTAQTHAALGQAAAALGERWLDVPYHALCDAPRDAVQAALDHAGLPARSLDAIPQRFARRASSP